MRDYLVFFDPKTVTYSIRLDELTADMLKAISNLMGKYGRTVRRPAGR